MNETSQNKNIRRLLNKIKRLNQRKQNKQETPSPASDIKISREEFLANLRMGLSLKAQKAKKLAERFHNTRPERQLEPHERQRQRSRTRERQRVRERERGR